MIVVRLETLGFGVRTHTTVSQTGMSSAVFQTNIEEITHINERGRSVESTTGFDIEHEISADCPCGPTVKPVKKEDGSIDWIYIHHRLDGGS